MKEVDFIDIDWQHSIDLLSHGESVFLCASEYYGKKYFLQRVRSSDSFINNYTIVNINHIKDSEALNFQDVLNHFQTSVVLDSCLLANNQHDFINAIETLVKENSFLVLISNSYRSYKNVSILVDALHEIILKHPNGYKKNITVLLTDDYSLYYYENKRTVSNESSSWFFFKKVFIRQLTETSIIEKWLCDFFHNKQLTSKIVKSLMSISGGHPGLIIEIINNLVIKWKSINFDSINDEIEKHISQCKFIDSLRQELSKLSLKDLEYLYSFKNKKLIEAHQNDIVRRFHIKGVLVKNGDLHIELTYGSIRELLIKIYKSKTMGNQKKLILCIHGLDGSEQTWSKFKDLYSKDVLLKEEYDFDTYVFPTSMWWNFNFVKAQDPPINQLAEGLKTTIEFKFSEYSEIVLVCHSLGGLVGRKYLLEKYLANKYQNSEGNNSLEINKIIMYATPHNGSSIANVARHVAIRNKQVKQLCKNSDFLQELNDKWMKLGAHEYYKGWYVVGGKDQIVDKSSSELFWGNNRCQTIINADHFSIIKPENEKSLSFLIFRKVLLGDAQDIFLKQMF